MDASDIDVDTEDQRVTLKGTVASQAEEDRAVQIAKNTGGVISVTSELVVQKKE